MQKRGKIVSIDMYYFRERLSATVGLRAHPEQDDSRVGQRINLHIHEGSLSRGLLKRASFHLSLRGVQLRDAPVSFERFGSSNDRSIRSIRGRARGGLLRKFMLER